jgi:hypothetical protein
MNKNSQETSKKNKKPEKIAQMEGKCYCCRKTGHMSPQCHFKDKLKNKWFVNKSQQSHVQANKKEKSTDLKSTNSTYFTSNAVKPRVNRQVGQECISSFIKHRK